MEYNDNVLNLAVSDLSSCIGDNKFSPKEIMIIKLWKKKDNKKNIKSFDEALKRNNINKYNISDIKEDNINKNINSKIKSYEKTIKNLKNGKKNESKIADLYQSIEKIKIKNNNEKLYKTFINKKHEKLLYHDKIIIQGFIDGIVNEESNNYIVEIKDRQYKIFDKIPDYEITQIMSYMFMTKIHKCKHIQKYQEKIKTEIIYFNEDKWEHIQEKIIDFVDYFEKIYFNDIF